MAEKKLSPLIELLNHVRYMRKILPPAAEMSSYAKGKDGVYAELETKIESLLPKEKQFAKDMWDGGYNKGYEDAGDDSFVGKKNPVPDFFNYLKQYQP